MKTGPVVLLLLSCLAGCAYISPPPEVQPQQPNVVSLDPENWYINYSSGEPPHPSPDTEGVWSFNFPIYITGGHVNYVQTPFNATGALHSISITFKVESGSPQYFVIDPTDILPATVHLFIEQKNDDLVNPNGRWWSNSSGYNLGSQDNETLTINMPLTSDLWTNVYGQQDPQAFAAALANIGWVGITCGGQYFWGHGVAVATPSAKYILIDYQVN